MTTVCNESFLQIGQLIEAGDTYAGWLDGKATSAARLDHAAETLEPVALHAPPSAWEPGEVDRTEWHWLLGLRLEHQRIGPQRSAPEISIQR